MQLVSRLCHYSDCVIPSLPCRGFNTDYALQKAKENVERHYAVVGVLEDLNTTLTVLEHYVPRFFKDAKHHYWSEYDLFFLYIFFTHKNTPSVSALPIATFPYEV